MRQSPLTETTATIETEYTISRETWKGGQVKLARTTVALVVATAGGLLVGVVAAVADQSAVADVAWALTGTVAAVPLIVGFVGSIRRREWGLDIIAVLAVVGSIALGEYLAAAIIGLMLATGDALDSYAAARAKHELTALLQRAPREAHVVVGEEVTTVGVDEVRQGDRLIVKAGEVVPVDGLVATGNAVLDESSLTGEVAPAVHPAGDHIASGTVNAGDSFEVVALKGAEDSTYAGIVRLVAAAQTAKAPISRLADRYAFGFVPLALAIAALAWLLSGDPVRGLSVLVVATPCPLLLAVPIAIVSGVSRAANRGVVVKGGGVLERLADAEILIIDKTGTLTVGEASIAAVTAFGPDLAEDELLWLGASLDQMSNHILAAALVRAARSRDIELDLPKDVEETPGGGIAGRVAGHDVALGSAAFVARGREVPAVAAAYQARAARSPSIDVSIAVDGAVVGAFRLVDEVRTDTPRTIRLLRQRGIRSVVMATGDHPVVAESVGAAIGADRVLAQCTPVEKLEAVQAATADGVTVMVGDGVNDAPALAAADVGVAMGARGATSSSEAADVVLVVDRLDRLAVAMRLAQRSRRIASQSAFLGMGLALLAMLAATFGLFGPVAGAILQEAIDVLAILSALRALRDGSGWGAQVLLPSELSARLKAEHDELMPKLADIGRLADRLGNLGTVDALAELQRIDNFVQEEILPHERQDDREIYPVLSKLIGGEDPMAAMSLTHGEIFKLSGTLHRMVEDMTTLGDPGDDLFDARRVMYSLDAVLRLHFAQEEELYQTLDESYHEQTVSGAQ